MAIVQHEMHISLRILACIAHRKAAQIEPHVKDAEANPYRLLQRLLLAMSDEDLLLNRLQITQGDLLAEPCHLSHLLDRVLDLVDGILELADHRIPHAAAVARVILVQDFSEQVAVTVSKLDVCMI